MSSRLESLRWEGGADGTLHLLDQTLLPSQHVVLALQDMVGVADAILRLAVRGAPALGVAGAYGLVLGVRQAVACGQPFEQALSECAATLRATRPTAVNLGWAIDRLCCRGASEPSLDALLAEAKSIDEEDKGLCRNIGEHGAHLVQDGMTVLTHCNAGALATAGMGTALSVMFTAWEQGRRFQVLADETRPLFQGSRLTALELHTAGIPVDIIVDGAAAGLMARGAVDLVITGADRIAANGDTANKVGTYGVALAARAHGVPMYIAAPVSTFDLSLPAGADIPIEDRDPSEVLEVEGNVVAAPGAGARNPAFDVTPAAYLAGLITDRGLITPVTAERIKEVLESGR